MTLDQITLAKELGKIPFEVVTSKGIVKTTLAISEEQLKSKFIEFISFKEITWDEFLEKRLKK